MKSFENPYPEDIFAKPSKKDWERLHKCLEKCGITLDCFAAEFGRNVWNNCCRKWREYLKEKGIKGGDIL